MNEALSIIVTRFRPLASVGIHQHLASLATVNAAVQSQRAFFDLAQYDLITRTQVAGVITRYLAATRRGQTSPILPTNKPHVTTGCTTRPCQSFTSRQTPGPF